MKKTIQRSFTSGELSPSLHSRADVIKYATGLKSCENFLVRPQGGVYSRPGFRFIGELSDSSRKGRLIPFSFNTDQTYVLVFEHLKMRVIRNGAYVLAPDSSIFELVTPYTDDQLSRLDYTQSADVMTIVHPDHDVHNLGRLDHDNWSLNVIDYSPSIEPPVLPSPTVRVISGASNGSTCQITANSHGFTTGNLVTVTGVTGMTELNGRTFRITVINAHVFSLDGENSSLYDPYTGGGSVTRNENANSVGSGFSSFVKTYAYVITTVDSSGSESIASTPISITTGSLSTTGGIRLNWDAVTGSNFYRIYKDSSNNTGVFGWIGDSKNNTFDDYNIAPMISDAPPEDRQPFSGINNKPSVVGYYQQRQVFANTHNEPQAVYTTQTGDFTSLRTSNPSRDTDAVTFTINAQQVNEIRHFIPLDTLIVLTSGGEWVTSEGQDRVLTPSTIGARVQSYNGSSWVKPAVINNTAIYVQEKGTKVRDLVYEFSGDRYSGNDLSIMSDHLFDGHKVIEMSYASEPYGILWCVRDDGVMLGLTYQREHQVVGWHRHTTKGAFESVTVISEDGRDAVYSIVRRTVGGVTRRYVERMEKREGKNSEDAFYVDSGLSYDGVPVTSVSGLDHLEGEPVSILADGYVITGMVVTNGSIEFNRPVSKVHVGLPYTPVIELLDIDIQSPIETVKDNSVSVSKVVIEVQGTRGGFVGPTQNESSVPFQEIKPRFDSDAYSNIELKSYKQEVFISPQWGQGGGVRIEQRSPLPMAILSVIPRFDIGG